MISNAEYVKAILTKIKCNSYLLSEYEKANMRIEVGVDTFITIKPILFVDGEPAEGLERKQKLHEELIKEGFEYRESMAINDQFNEWKILPEGYYPTF